jgi:hypothetical protein
MDKTPSFYKNLTDLPGIEKLDGNVIVSDTLLPIVGEPIQTQVTYDFLGEQRFIFPHTFKNILDIFARFKQVGTNDWYTIPAIYFSVTGGPAESVIIDNITNTEIAILFNAVNFAYNKTFDLEIYFTNFSFG